MTFIPATETAIIHPNAQREEMPIEILIELDAFEAALSEPQPELDEDFDAWLEDIEELDADAIEFIDEVPSPHGSAAAPAQQWPRSFGDHLAETLAAGDDPVARRALSLMGLGDVSGLEPVVAGIAKTSEALVFWQPMLGMEQDGFFTAHIKELRGCLALLEAHPAPAHNPALRLRWEAARDELLDLLPAWACGGATAVC